MKPELPFRCCCGKLYLASSEQNAKAKMQELVDENIKKGWEKV